MEVAIEVSCLVPPISYKEGQKTGKTVENLSTKYQEDMECFGEYLNIDRPVGYEQM